MNETRRKKTHCKYGHELTANNTNAAGRCKVCAAEAVRKTYSKKREEFVGPRRPHGHPARTTICRYGHELTADNTTVKGECRVCARKANLRYYARKREEFVGPRRPQGLNTLKQASPEEREVHARKASARYYAKKKEEFVGPRRPRQWSPTKEVCSRGHLRTPDNLNSSGQCKTCRRELDAKRNRHRQAIITPSVVATMMKLPVADIPPDVIAMYRERVLLKRERRKQNGTQHHQ